MLLPEEGAEVSWIDVTVGLHDKMVSWPGDPTFKASRPMDMANGDIANVTQIELGVHTGTHMDAPEHFIAGAPTMDAMPLKATVGVARVVEIQHPRFITAEELAPHDLQPGERILFKTRNSDRDWSNEPFDPHFVHINADGARFMVERGVRTVGIDYLSVGAYEGDGVETHHVLLGAGIWIIEGLDLSKVGAGHVELVCLPMKILGAEGAPARVIVRPIDLSSVAG